MQRCNASQGGVWWRSNTVSGIVDSFLTTTMRWLCQACRPCLVSVVSVCHFSAVCICLERCRSHVLGSSSDKCCDIYTVRSVPRICKAREQISREL